jgi:hypothetical protein
VIEDAKNVMDQEITTVLNVLMDTTSGKQLLFVTKSAHLDSIYHLMRDIQKIRQNAITVMINVSFASFKVIIVLRAPELVEIIVILMLLSFFLIMTATQHA